MAETAAYNPHEEAMKNALHDLLPLLDENVYLSGTEKNVLLALLRDAARLHFQNHDALEMLFLETLHDPRTKNLLKKLQEFLEKFFRGNIPDPDGEGTRFWPLEVFVTNAL